MKKWPLILIGVRVLPHSPGAALFLSATPSFNHGCESSTSRQCPLLAECGHRGHESREGGLECDPRQGRFWFRQCYSHNDQGMFSPLLRSYSGFTCKQDSMANKADYVELGLACADVCEALNRGMNGKNLDDLSQSVRKAINQLTAWVKPMARSLDSSPTMLSIAEL